MKKYVIFIVCVLHAISSFAIKDLWDTNKADWTPLMCAIYYNQTALRDSLLHTEVNVNKRTRNGLTALTVAIRKQDVESVKRLLETGRINDINDNDTSKGYRYRPRHVYIACSLQDTAIVQLLAEYGAIFDTVDSSGYTPLMAAVSFGSIEIVKWLLESKVNIDQQQTVGGMTALGLALYGGHIDKIKLLLEYGADKNKMDTKGRRVYDKIDYTISIGRISEEEGEELRVLLK